MEKTTTRKARGLEVACRPGTTDESAFKRCVEQRCWFKVNSGFIPQPGERWLELGANIGAFTLMACAQGAHVTAYEPMPDNAAIWQENVNRNGFSGKAALVNAAVTWDGIAVPFHIPASERNHYRCSIFGKKDWKEVRVNFARFDSIDLNQFDGIKMDMEGAEIEILERVATWGKVRKLAFAYHFCNEPRVARYDAICERLRSTFKVNCRAVKGPIFAGFPDDRHVFCMR